jgi:hypothetical protein
MICLHVRLSGVETKFSHLVETGKVTRVVDVLVSEEDNSPVFLPSGKLPVFLRSQCAKNLRQKLPDTYNREKICVAEENLSQLLVTNRFSKEVVVNPTRVPPEEDNTVFRAIFEM